MTYVLGHDSHAHQITSQTGCTGTITIPVDGEHDDAANIFAVFDADVHRQRRADHRTRQHILQPRHRQAEHFSDLVGHQARSPRPTAEGGKTVGDIDNGDWIAFDAVQAEQRHLGSPPGSPPAGAGGTAAGPHRLADRHACSAPRPSRSTGGWETFTDVTGTDHRRAGRHHARCTWCSPARHRARCSTWTPSRSPPAPYRPPARIEGESYTSQNGVQAVGRRHRARRRPLGYIESGDWAGIPASTSRGRTGFTARVSSGGAGGTIQVRSGSATGPLLGSANVGNTGGYGTFVDVNTTLSAGSGALFLVFVGTGTGGLFDVDDFALTGGTTPPATNLALNKTATADSQCAATEGPAKAVNGTVNGGNADKWCSLGASKWWRVDLGASPPSAGW